MNILERIKGLGTYIKEDSGEVKFIEVWKPVLIANNFFFSGYENDAQLFRL